MSTSRTSFLTAALVGVFAVRAAAQCDEYQLPEVPQAAHQFGGAVDIGGNLLVFGAPHATVVGEKAAFGWRRVTGGWVGAFAVLPGSANDQFGASISVSPSGPIAIGAPGASNSSGGTGVVTMLFWDGSQGSYHSLIQPPTNLGYPVEEFGRSVSVSENGQWLIVGAPKTFGNAGCIFLYRNVAGSWVFQQDAFLGSNPDRFGHSAAISGTKVIAGSPAFDGAPGVDSGAVFFYDVNEASGTLTQTGQFDGPSPNSGLGIAVAIDGTLSAAGAPLDDTFGVDGGAVFFYVNGGGAGGFGQVNGQNLGASIDIDDGNILVGRPGGDVVDRYKLNAAGTLVEYVETFGAAPLNAQSGDRYGTDVAIDGEECAVGAPLYDDPSFFVDSGRLLTYENIFDSMAYVDLGKSLSGSLGAPSLVLSGDMCAGFTYNIALSNAKASSISAMIVGISAINSPFNGGTLVPNPNVVVVLPTSASGTVNLSPPWPVGLDAVPLIFQWWIQDPTGVFGLTASNAVQTVPPGYGS